MPVGAGGGGGGGGELSLIRKVSTLISVTKNAIF